VTFHPNLFSVSPSEPFRQGSFSARPAMFGESADMEANFVCALFVSFIFINFWAQ